MRYCQLTMAHASDVILRVHNAATTELDERCGMPAWDSEKAINYQHEVVAMLE